MRFSAQVTYTFWLSPGWKRYSAWPAWTDWTHPAWGSFCKKIDLTAFLITFERRNIFWCGFLQMKADEILFQMAWYHFSSKWTQKGQKSLQSWNFAFLDHFLQILCKFWTFYHLQIQKIFAGREAPHPEVRFEKKIIKKYSFLTKWRQKGRNRPKWAPRNVKCHKMTKNNPIMLKFSQNVQFSYIFHCTKFEIISMTLSDVKWR